MYSYLHHHCARFPGWQSAVAFVGLVWVGAATPPGSPPPALVSSGLLGSQPRRTWGPCRPAAALDAGLAGEASLLLKIGCCLSGCCCRLLQQHLVSTVVVKILGSKHCCSSSQSSLLLDSLSPSRALLLPRCCCCCCECSLSVQGDSLLKCCLLLGW